MKKNKKTFVVIFEVLLWPLFMQAIIYCVCELFRPVFNFFFTHMHNFYYDCIRISEYGMFYFYAFHFKESANSQIQSFLYCFYFIGSTDDFDANHHAI